MNTVSYTITNRQREKVFTHALGLIMSVCSIKEFDKTREGQDCRVHNGVDAMEVEGGINAIQRP